MQGQVVFKSKNAEISTELVKLGGVSIPVKNIEAIQIRGFNAGETARAIIAAIVCAGVASLVNVPQIVQWFFTGLLYWRCSLLRCRRKNSLFGSVVVNSN